MNQDRPNIIQKFYFPKLVTLFFSIIICLYVVLCGKFFIFEFSKHHEIGKNIRQADNAFMQKDYASAISLYEQVLYEYPQYKHGRGQVTKAYFALSENDDDNYLKALANLTQEENYTAFQLDQILLFVPLFRRSDVRALFKFEAEEC